MGSSPLRKAKSVDQYKSILLLNDDCLFEIFKYLRPIDLGAVADCCRRLQKNAQIHFASSKFKEFIIPGHLCRNYSDAEPRSYWQTDVPDEIQLLESNHCLMIKRATKLLRNFGPFMKSILIQQFDGELLCVGVIKRYYLEAPIQLEVYKYDTDTYMMVAGLPMKRLINLQKLVVSMPRSCPYFLMHLLDNAPDIQEIIFEEWYWKKFSFLNRSFPKLTKISFFDQEYVDNNQIESFLKRHPKLKSIEFFHCVNLDDHVFQFISEHVPQIEEVKAHLGDQIQLNQDGAKCFGKMIKLNSLKLRLPPDGSQCMTSIINEISASEIPLKHLNLSEVDFAACQFTEAISNLKTLNTLTLAFALNLTMDHILGICKHVTELSELRLYYCDEAINFSGRNLLEIVRSAEKIQVISIQGNYGGYKKSCIDAGIFHRMVETIEQRSEKTHFNLVLDSATFCAAEIPAYNKFVSLKLTCDVTRNKINKWSAHCRCDC